MASTVRHHYMLGATVVVLGLAAAAGLGYFDEPVPPQGTAGPAETAANPVVFVPGPARTTVPTRPFEITIFLVSTPEQQAAVYAAENTYRSPYLMGGRSAEVLIVRTAEEELMAAYWFEEVRASFPGANVVVADLR